MHATTDSGRVFQRNTFSLLGPVDPSFRALSGRLKFTARRHKFNKDFLPACARDARLATTQTLTGRPYTNSGHLWLHLDHAKWTALSESLSDTNTDGPPFHKQARDLRDTPSHTLAHPRTPSHTRSHPLTPAHTLSQARDLRDAKDRAVRPSEHLPVQGYLAHKNPPPP